MRAYFMKYNKILSILLSLTFLHLVSCRKEPGPDQPDPPEPEGDYVVVAYVPGWGSVDFASMPADQLTHINYAFTKIQDGKIHSEMTEDSLYLTNLVNLKNINADLNILVSVGGATWSSDFSDMALTDSSRKVFSWSVIDFIKKYDLDGVDLDWEFPGSSLAGVYRLEDRQNFTALLEIMRTHLDSLSEAHQRMDSKPYLLTIAAGASSYFTSLVEMDKIVPLLDFLNIMNYDYMGSWSSTTGHHTNLYASSYSGGAGYSTSESIHLYQTSGVPKNKIVVGAAFYGRWWGGVNNQANGIYQNYSGGAGALTYRTIKTSYLSDPDYTRYWDNEAKAPYLWSSTDQVFITYDDEYSIYQKVKFVREKRLGGIMFWEYSQDYNQELMNAVIWGFQ